MHNLMALGFSAAWHRPGLTCRRKSEPFGFPSFGQRWNLTATESRDTVLVVDGGPECRRVLGEPLLAGCRVIEAADGLEALERARSAVPSLVLSSVRLARLDGYHLCAALRMGEKTRHIPVVLVSGSHRREERLKALGVGADCHLVKPLDPIEMAMHIYNLIERGRVLREHFSRTDLQEPFVAGVASADERLLAQVLAAVEAHLDEPTFDVGTLGRAVGLSRSQLHRRISTITHQPPRMLIRSIRLARAAELLKTRGGSVAEIAYMVGFSSQAYFATCFRRQFNCSPRQYGASGPCQTPAAPPERKRQLRSA